MYCFNSLSCAPHGNVKIVGQFLLGMHEESLCEGAEVKCMPGCALITRPHSSALCSHIHIMTSGYICLLFSPMY